MSNPDEAIPLYLAPLVQMSLSTNGRLLVGKRPEEVRKTLHDLIMKDVVPKLTGALVSQTSYGQTFSYIHTVMGKLQFCEFALNALKLKTTDTLLTFQKCYQNEITKSAKTTSGAKFGGMSRRVGGAGKRGSAAPAAAPGTLQVVMTVPADDSFAHLVRDWHTAFALCCSTCPCSDASSAGAAGAGSSASAAPVSVTLVPRFERLLTPESYNDMNEEEPSFREAAYDNRERFEEYERQIIKKISNVPLGGYGVFYEGDETIPPNTYIGFYKGALLPKDVEYDCSYILELQNKAKITTRYSIDACRTDVSNWTSRMNDAHNSGLTNNMQFAGPLVYTCKPVNKGDELLVEYGSSYWDPAHANPWTLPRKPAGGGSAAAARR